MMKNGNFTMRNIRDKAKWWTTFLSKEYDAVYREALENCLLQWVPSEGEQKDWFKQIQFPIRSTESSN